MGTVAVGQSDLGAAASDLAPVIEQGRGRPEPFPDRRTQFAQPLGILGKHDVNDDDDSGRRDLVVPLRLTNSALGRHGPTGVVPKVISLSTGQ
jgi:hypothetical protein